MPSPFSPPFFLRLLAPLLALILLVVAPHLAAAEGARPPLDGGTIERVLGVVSEMRRDEAKWDDLIAPNMAMSGLMGAAAGGPGIIERSLPAIQNDPRYPELDTLAQRNGFASFADFAPAGDRVMRAYMALKMGPEMEEAAREMQQGLAEIDSDPNMTPEMKAMLKGQLSTFSSMMTMFEAPEADKAAMQPYLAAYDAALDFDEMMGDGAPEPTVAPSTLGVPPAASTANDQAARMEQLDGLKASGLISDDIYEAKRREILGLPEPSAEPTLEDRLAKLKGLKEQGLITEDMYQQKVQEILSEL